MKYVMEQRRHKDQSAQATSAAMLPGTYQSRVSKWVHHALDQAE
jgi:hypothetical protein